MSELAWHFLRQDRRLGYDDNHIVEAGETITVDCEPVLCQSGLHGSVRIIDALQYAPGPIICRVEIGGTIVCGDDKLVGTSRKCLWWIDGTNLLHEFACRVAEQALKAANVTDMRCWAAIEAKRKWLCGEIDEAQLAVAWDAARDAAWAAAWAAARDAAWDAAWDAARAAARAAAWDAAWAAARDAAWGAARDAQNTLLESMVMEAKAGEGEG